MIGKTHLCMCAICSYMKPLKKDHFDTQVNSCVLKYTTR